MKIKVRPAGLEPATPCLEGEGASAFWPWLQIVRSYAQAQELKKLLSIMGPGAADIAQVVQRSALGRQTFAAAASVPGSRIE